MTVRVLLCAAGVAAAAAQSDSPIIGVLTTPLLEGGHCVTAGLPATVGSRSAARGGGSCFHSVYVKWIESAGGRVVPLLFDAPPAETDALLDSLNGLLFTGGEVNVTDLGSQYMETAARLLRRTLEANAAGEHVPLWGTCMGFQMLSVLVSGEPKVLKSSAFDSESLMLPLDLPNPTSALDSRMLASLPADVLEWLTTENMTVNLHHDGVSPEDYRDNSKLRDFFRVVSTNVDRKGLPFVSTIEGHSSPVYGVQWHPERPQFQFSVSAGEDGINHKPHAIRAMQAMANFFVDESRLNGRHFAMEEEEVARLIYNYAPSGPPGDSYQAYVFPPAGSNQVFPREQTWV